MVSASVGIGRPKGSLVDWLRRMSEGVPVDWPMPMAQGLLIRVDRELTEITGTFLAYSVRL